MRANVTNVIEHSPICKELVPLALHKTGEQVATIVIGGPATGKSTTTRMLELSGRDLGAKIGSDDYKELLADPKKLGTAFGELTHPESAHIAELTRARIEEKAAKGQSPNYTVEKFVLQPAYADSVLKTGAKLDMVVTFSDDPA